MVASSHPLGYVKDGTCANTEAIREVLVATLFMLIIPEGQKKQHSALGEGETGLEEKKKGMLMFACYEVNVHCLWCSQIFFMTKCTGFSIN